jgi:hypothetical protein
MRTSTVIIVSYVLYVSVLLGATRVYADSSPPEIPYMDSETTAVYRRLSPQGQRQLQDALRDDARARFAQNLENAAIVLGPGALGAALGVGMKFLSQSVSWGYLRVALAGTGLGLVSCALFTLPVAIAVTADSHSRRAENMRIAIRRILASEPRPVRHADSVPGGAVSHAPVSPRGTSVEGHSDRAPASVRPTGTDPADRRGRRSPSDRNDPATADDEVLISQ